MKCPYCGFNESKVIDSRPADENNSIRRRRECLSCSRRFTTYETVESLPVEADAEKVSFPWFADGQDGDAAKAYTHFITALCDMARKQKRVTAKERPADNEKYAFRCFLLRLGFIGEEYKGERKVLLKNLSGNGSFKSGARKGAADNDISE